MGPKFAEAHHFDNNGKLPGHVKKKAAKKIVKKRKKG